MTKSSAALAVALGFLVALLPAFEHHLILPLALLCCAFFERVSAPDHSSKWAWPFAGVLLAWVIAQLLTPGNLAGLQIYFERSSLTAALAGLWSWFDQNPPDYFLSLQSLLRWLLLAWLFKIFRSAPHLFAPIKKGLALGVFLALVVALLQITDLMPLKLPNQSAYWDALGRISATFTDPNAFGLFMLLSLPLLFEGLPGCNSKLSATCYAIALLAAMFLTAFSGSRSFVLGAIIYGAILLFFHSRKIFFYAGAFSIATVILLNLLSITAGAQFFEYSGLLPSALERTVLSVVWNEADNAFFSRWAFNRVGFAIWSDNPLSGVGLSHFALLFPAYAAELSVPTGLWSDNSNNYYLGILAELGACGLFLFLLSLSKLQVAEKGNAYSMAALATFAVLLLFGPHLDFNEITVLIGLHMARALSPRGGVRYGTGFYLCLTLLVCLVFVQNRYAEFGWYQWEGTAKQGFRRWSTAHARSTLPCDAQGRATLSFSVLHPDLSKNPLTIRIEAAFNEERNLTVTQPGTLQFEFECYSPSVFSERRFQLTNLPFELSVSRAWSPLLSGVSGDARPLGIYRNIERIEKPVKLGSWFDLGTF